MSRRAALALLAPLWLLFTVLGLVQAWRDTPVWDEGIYIAAGVTTLTRHEIRINFEHPPLAKVVAALPALLAHPEIPTGDSWESNRQFAYTGEFVGAQLDTGKLQRVVFLSRLVPLAEGLLAAVVIYALATHLFGRSAGVLASATWLTTPFVLGLAHTATLDIPFTLATLIACLALQRALDQPDLRRIILLGLACGAALLVRTTGLLLVPALLAALLIGTRHRLGWRSVGAAALVLALAWASVWGVTRGLAPSPRPVPSDRQLELPTENAPAQPPQPGRALAVLAWPEEYATGIRYLARASWPPAPAFLLGQAWDGPRWWYWPGSMLVKLALPMLVMLFLGLASWRAVSRPARRRALLVLAVPSAVLAGFTIAVPRPIGLRYLLPVIGLWLVAASPLAAIARRRAGMLVLALLVLVQVVVLATSFPHSISWTSPPFHPGYRHATDSNLDWGQDFYRLQEWAEARNPWVAYFGGPGLSVGRVPGARPLLEADVREVRGWVAASASLLTAYARDDLAWLRKYCSVDNLGGTILLFRFEQAPDPSPGPPAPVSPCEGAGYSQIVSAGKR